MFLLVPLHLGSPGQRAGKNGCVCARARARVWSLMCHLETNHSGILKLVFFGGSKQPVQQN